MIVEYDSEFAGECPLERLQWCLTLTAQTPRSPSIDRMHFQLCCAYTIRPCCILVRQRFRSAVRAHVRRWRNGGRGVRQCHFCWGLRSRGVLINDVEHVKGDSSERGSSGKGRHDEDARRKGDSHVISLSEPTWATWYRSFETYIP